MATLPKWNDERTESLSKFVGDEVPVSYATVIDAAASLDTSTRSIASKLRKMGYVVESSTATVTRAFTDSQADTLRTFVENNSGDYTYAEIAAAFEEGKFSAKQIQGKLLSMQLTESVKATPKVEAVRSFSESEEAVFVKMAHANAFLEDIAEALGRTINQVRGKALSLLRQDAISSIPAQKESKAAARVDPLDGVDVASMSVEEIAEKIEKTVRGVKTMLTRRSLTATNYDGAAKADKAAKAATAS